MTKEEAIYWFGSQNKLASFLGVYQSNISGWKNIPRHHQITIEKHTNGELEAENTDKMKRYQVTIEEKYLNMIKTLAEMHGVSGVQIVRNSLSYYYKSMTQSKID